MSLDGLQHDCLIRKGLVRQEPQARIESIQSGWWDGMIAAAKGN